MGGGGGGAVPPTPPVSYLCRDIQSLVGHAIQVASDSHIAAIPKS